MNPRPARSRLEQLLDDAIAEVYGPDILVVHEMPIKIGRQTLYVDRAIPSKKLCFEAHGIQHTHDSDFFFKEKGSFRAAQQRDAAKLEALHDLGYSVVVVPHNWKGGVQSLRDMILKAFETENPRWT